MSDKHSVCLAQEAPEVQRPRFYSPFLDTSPSSSYVTPSLFQELLRRPTEVRPKTLPIGPTSMHVEYSELLVRASHLFGTTPAEILGRDRHKNVAGARHAVAWAARHLFDWSYPELGRKLAPCLSEAKDHTTMMAAVRRVDAAVASGTELGRRALLLIGPSKTSTPEDAQHERT